jgi:hypothetical protein
VFNCGAAPVKHRGLHAAEKINYQRINHFRLFQIAVMPAAGKFLVPAAGNIVSHLTTEMRRCYQIILKTYHKALGSYLAIFIKPVSERLEPMLGEVRRWRGQ